MERCHRAALVLCLLLVPSVAPTPQRASARRLTCPESCPDSFRPVCGSDNKVYKNECSFRLAACKDTSLRKLNDGPCKRTAPSPCREECTKIYTPVCGSDGKTYNNPCVMEAESCKMRQANPSLPKVTIRHTGQCEPRSTPEVTSDGCERECPQTYQPVCGSNGRTYDNRCLLEVAACRSRLRQRYEGVCAVPHEDSGSSPPAASNSRPAADAPQNSQAPVARCPTAQDCTGGFRPVCGSDGVTYGSDCLLEVAKCTDPTLQKKSDGVCVKDCSLVCYEDVEEVCGSDGRTYINDCYLAIARCKDSSLKKASNGRCSGETRRTSCDKVCSITYQPVCGSDGVTYTNPCTLDAATCTSLGLVKLYDGPCSQY